VIGGTCRSKATRRPGTGHDPELPDAADFP
jgi:hypothetical protein